MSITLTWPTGTDDAPWTNSVSAAQLIKNALVLLGAIDPQGTPSASLASQGLSVLSEILDTWAADRFFMFSQSRTVYPLVNGQAEYTIGVGGDFDQDCPAMIDAINVVDTTATPVFEFPPLSALNDKEWAEVAFKAMESTLPQGYTFDPRPPLGTLTFAPVPQGMTYSVAIYVPTGILTGVGSLTTMISGPKGFARALRYQLAADLSMIPGLSPAPRGDLGKVASMAISRIKGRNIQVGVLGTDEALSGGGFGYNWRTGE